MARLLTFQPYIPGLPSGVEVWVNYNEVNSRLQSAEWSNLTGHSIRVRVWDGGVLAFDRTITQESGTQTIAGNYRLVDNGEFLELPPNITYAFEFSMV